MFYRLRVTPSANDGFDWSEWIKKGQVEANTIADLQILAKKWLKVTRSLLG